MMYQKKLNVLQVFKLEQKLPRAFDLYHYISNHIEDFIEVEDGFVYQILEKGKDFINIDIEKKRNSGDLPYIKNTQTKRVESIENRLVENEILAEKGRCTIFKGGLVIIEYNKHAGGSKAPITALLNYIAKNNDEKSAKLSYYYHRTAFEECIKEIKKGQLSLEVIEPSKLFSSYDLGEQNVPKQRIILSFKNGDQILVAVKEVVADGVAKIMGVKDKESNKAMQALKGIHTTRVSKDINITNTDDEKFIFDSIHQYRSELEVKNYFISSGLEITQLGTDDDL
jgi:hypothetical protein